MSVICVNAINSLAFSIAEQSSSIYAYLDQPLPAGLVALCSVVWCGHILTCGKCQMVLLRFM